ANPIFHGDEKAVTTDEAAAPVERKKDIDSVDFEKKLEESLKNLKKAVSGNDETYEPKFHCRRQSGMNFGYVTVNGVNSNT
ncbi:hypothetical protein OSJ98_26375, partial [Escherichia coli]|nr:hypothetical protein [Escherichia coli]